MTFSVRIFGFIGTQQIPCVNRVQDQTDSVQQIAYPALFSQLLTTNGATPVSSTPDINSLTRILRIEVQDGNSIRFEVNPPNRNVAASTLSPRFSGVDNFAWGPGYVLSIVDAASFP